MRLLRNLFTQLRTTGPNRTFAHVHDVQIKWERAPIERLEGKQNKASMSLGRNGMYSLYFTFLGFLGSGLVGKGREGECKRWDGLEWMHGLLEAVAGTHAVLFLACWLCETRF